MVWISGGVIETAQWFAQVGWAVGGGERSAPIAAIVFAESESRTTETKKTG